MVTTYQNYRMTRNNYFMRTINFMRIKQNNKS